MLWPPRILGMIRPAAGDYGDNIKPPVETAKIRSPRHPKLGRAGDPPSGCVGDRFQGQRHVAPRFHLDKGNKLAATGDQVNFPGRCPGTAGQYAVTFQHQGHGGNPFAPPAPAFCFSPISHARMI